MRSAGQVVLAAAALASASCYATYERGVAAANARDWPAAETELWRYLRIDCVTRDPPITCKQAVVKLGEVLIEDDRPTSAARVFRLAQKLPYKKLETPEVDRALNARIADGLVTAKQRWDRFRSGVPGQCQLVARYGAPRRALQLVGISAHVDMEQFRPPAGPGEPSLLFDKTTSAGPHEVTVFAVFADPARRGFRYAVDTAHYRSCADGEKIELVFQTEGTDGSDLRFAVAAAGGKPLPHEGPLRPLPQLAGW
jgi:hypothetical protein